MDLNVGSRQYIIGHAFDEQNTANIMGYTFSLHGGTKFVSKSTHFYQGENLKAFSSAKAIKLIFIVTTLHPSAYVTKTILFESHNSLISRSRFFFCTCTSCSTLMFNKTREGGIVTSFYFLTTMTLTMTPLVFLPSR